MSDLVPFYEPRFLRYAVESFAKIAVSNAIWLTGEWIALGKPNMSTFRPNKQYATIPRRRDEAIVMIDCCSKMHRYEFFLRSFWHGANQGGEHVFSLLQREHAELLAEALESEWARISHRPG